MVWITNAKYIKDFELELQFNDGKVLTVDLSKKLNGKIFEPLRSLDQFKKFRLDPELDTIVWENGADFSPEFLYENGIVKSIPSNTVPGDSDAKAGAK